MMWTLKLNYFLFYMYGYLQLHNDFVKEIKPLYALYLISLTGTGHRNQMSLGNAVPLPEPIKWGTLQIGAQRSDLVIWR